MSGAYFAKAWDLRLITLIGEQVGTASTPRLPPEHPRGSPEYPRLRGNPQSASGAPEEYREYPFNPPDLPLQLQGPLRTPASPLQCVGVHIGCKAAWRCCARDGVRARALLL